MKKTTQLIKVVIFLLVALISIPMNSSAQNKKNTKTKMSQNVEVRVTRTMGEYQLPKMENFYKHLEMDIFMASACGVLERVDFLITPHTDINAKDEHGAPIIYYAAQNGHKDIVEYLVRSQKTKDRIDIHATNKSNETALHAAAKNGHLEVVTFLVDYTDIKINAKNDEGKTALDLAKANNKPWVVEYLQSVKQKRK